MALSRSCREKSLFISSVSLAKMTHFNTLFGQRNETWHNTTFLFNTYTETWNLEYHKTFFNYYDPLKMAI